MTILKKLRLHEGSRRMGRPNHAAGYLAAPQTAWSTLPKGEIMRFAAAIATSLLLASCAGSPYQTGVEARQNRDNMLKLNVGQTKEQVLTLTGKPYKTEMYVVDGKPIEFWLYLTEGKPIYGQLRDSNFTPLAFENGVLKGWGRNYYDSTVRVKKDVTIEQK